MPKNPEAGAGHKVNTVSFNFDECHWDFQWTHWRAIDKLMNWSWDRQNESRDTGFLVKFTKIFERVTLVDLVGLYVFKQIEAILEA